MSVRDKVYVDIETGGTAKAGAGLKNLAIGAAAAAAAIAIVVKVGKELIEAYRVQEQVEAKMNATLTATGFAAGMTADQLSNMASALQSVTTFGDEEIMSGQNLLLTFRNIGEDTFPRATEAMLDMSTAMGTDLKSSAIQLGKALNDPKIGMTALQRAGITFTDSQKDAVAAMLETNDLAGAQDIILGELEHQFGGLSKAVGETATASFEQLSNTIGDFKEITGESLARALSPFITKLNEMTQKSNEAQKRLLDVRTAMDTIAGGGDAGDLTNELNTQLALIATMKDNIVGQLGYLDGRIEKEKKIFNELFAQQVKYKEQIAAAKELVKKAESRAEWEALLAGLDEKRAVKMQQFADIADEASENLFKSLDPLEQEYRILSDRNIELKAAEEFITKSAYLNKDQKASYEKQIELLQKEGTLNATRFDEITAELAARKELVEVQTDLNEATAVSGVDAYAGEKERLEEWLLVKEEMLGVAEEEALAVSAELQAAARKEEDAAQVAQQEAGQALLIQGLETGAGLIGQYAKAASNEKIAIAEDTADREKAVIASQFVDDKAALKAKLDSEKITQAEYDRALIGLEDTKNAALETSNDALEDAKKEEMRKQAINERLLAGFQVIISTAVAIAKAAPNPVLMGIAAAAGLISGIAIAAAPMPSFATGADFVTAGPQAIIVGDNPGGQERVSVTPIGSDNVNGPSGDQYMIYIGDEVVWDSVNRGSANGEVRIEKRSLVN